MQTEKVYFPNLNGLRFIAAFLVIIHHLEQIKSVLGFSNGSVEISSVLGTHGVLFFFVLSGFLITYLLLKEEEVTRKVSIKSFYMRRILRIWPLYYIVVFLSFFILPNIPFFDLPFYAYLPEESFIPNLILFLLFLPNAVLVLDTIIPYASQSWSIGVEEQFYILWPVLMKVIKNKVLLMIFVIVCHISVSIIVYQMLKMDMFHNDFKDCLEFFWRFWNNFSVQCMAIGGLFAVLLYKGNKVIVWLKDNTILNWCNLLLLVFLLWNGIVFPYFTYEIYAVLFGLLILHLSSGSKPVINLENKYFDYLGKISYGLYMYHAIAIVIAVKMLDSLGLNNYLLQLTVALLITVLIASLSYSVIEKRFVKLKSRFSKVISG